MGSRCPGSWLGALSSPPLVVSIGCLRDELLGTLAKSPQSEPDERSRWKPECQNTASPSEFYMSGSPDSVWGGGTEQGRGHQDAWNCGFPLAATICPLPPKDQNPIDDPGTFHH